jgi:hypothetical protein
MQVAPRVSRSALVCRADGGFIGSSTNIVRPFGLIEHGSCCLYCPIARWIASHISVLHQVIACHFVAPALNTAQLLACNNRQQKSCKSLSMLLMRLSGSTDHGCLHHRLPGSCPLRPGPLREEGHHRWQRPEAAGQEPGCRWPDVQRPRW